MSDEFELEERDPIADEAFRVLLDLFMVSDPWPLSDREKNKMYAFLTAEASKRGYDGWVGAYHEFEVDDE